MDLQLPAVAFTQQWSSDKPTFELSILTNLHEQEGGLFILNCLAAFFELSISLPIDLPYDLVRASFWEMY